MSRAKLSRTFGAKAGELERVANLTETELFGFFFQRGDQTFIEADGTAAFSADDVVMMVIGLLGKIQGFAGKNDPLDQAGFPERFQNSVDGGPVADLRSHLGMNLFRREGGGGLFQHLEDRPPSGSRLQAGLPEWIAGVGMGMTHGEVKWEAKAGGSRKKAGSETLTKRNKSH